MRSLALVLVAAAGTAGGFACPRADHTVQLEPRRMARIVVFSAAGMAGYAIQYGLPEWRDDYAAQFDELTVGKRWRLGRDFWTTLDTNVSLDIAGKKIKAGYYYVVLERSVKDVWSLVVMDADKVRKDGLDAAMVSATSGGTLVPLRHEPGEAAKALAIELQAQDDRHATLTIRFGPHLLTAPIKASV